MLCVCTEVFTLFSVMKISKFRMILVCYVCAYVCMCVCIQAGGFCPLGMVLVLYVCVFVCMYVYKTEKLQPYPDSEMEE